MNIKIRSNAHNKIYTYDFYINIFRNKTIVDFIDDKFFNNENKKTNPKKDRPMPAGFSEIEAYGPAEAETLLIDIFYVKYQ